MENQVRLISRNADSAVPVLIPGKVYKSNCCAKVKFLPADQAKILASRTLKKRKCSTQDSFSCSLKKARSSNTMISSNQSEPQRFVNGKGEKDNSSQQQNAAAHVKSPSHSAFSLEGSSSSLQAKLLEVGVVSKSDLESEMIKKKGYEKYFSLRKSFIREDGSSNAECHENDSASASTASYKPNKTSMAQQADCSDPCKVQLGGLPDSPASCERLYPAYGPASERIWKGNFEVPNLPQELQLCEGLTAHCAAKISTKAYILLKHIEGVLHFNSHPCRDFWLDVFKEDGPGLQDIAVYFYPGKFERSRKEYAALLKFIEKEDLMLRFVINHVELLVYPSKVLPLDSQKLGGSYFFWGVLRCLRG